MLSRLRRYTEPTLPMSVGEGVAILDAVHEIEANLDRALVALGERPEDHPHLRNKAERVRVRLEQMLAWWTTGPLMIRPRSDEAGARRWLAWKLLHLAWRIMPQSEERARLAVALHTVLPTGPHR